jgi:hypothetical protein
MTDSELPPNDAPYLVGYRRNLINGTTLLHSLRPAVTDVLRRKPWATMIRGEGWAIPTRYLAHTEALLAGANVDLFDIDGTPTPRQRHADDTTERAHTARVLADIQAATEQAVPMPPDVRHTLRQRRHHRA